MLSIAGHFLGNGFSLCGRVLYLPFNFFQVFVEFSGFGFLLLFIVFNAFLDALGDQPGLLFALAGPLGGPGYRHSLFTGFG